MNPLLQQPSQPSIWQQPLPSTSASGQFVAPNPPGSTQLHQPLYPISPMQVEAQRPSYQDATYPGLFYPPQGFAASLYPDPRTAPISTSQNQPNMQIPSWQDYASNFLFGPSQPLPVFSTQQKTLKGNDVILQLSSHIDKYQDPVSAQNTKATCDPVFNVKDLLTIKEDSDYVLGDADGSIFRVIMLAIHSGHLQLRSSLINKNSVIVEEAIDILAELAFQETAHINQGLAFCEQFQSSLRNQQKIQRLCELLVPVKSDKTLVIIGDLINDRFSSDKVKMALLLVILFLLGVVIIAGNHDVHNPDALKKEIEENKQFGSHALDTWTPEKWLVFQQKVLKFAHYDKKTGTLYNHTGVEKLPDDQDGRHVLMTAIGTYAFHGVFDPEQFVNIVNKKFHNMTWDNVVFKSFTDYRPTKEAVSAALKDMSPVKRLVQGHNGAEDLSGPDVFIFNPRKMDKGCMSACMSAGRLGSS